MRDKVVMKKALPNEARQTRIKSELEDTEKGLFESQVIFHSCGWCKAFLMEKRRAGKQCPQMYVMDRRSGNLERFSSTTQVGHGTNT